MDSRAADIMFTNMSKLDPMIEEMDPDNRGVMAPYSVLYGTCVFY